MLKQYGHIIRINWVKRCMAYEAEGVKPTGRPKNLKETHSVEFKTYEYECISECTGSRIRCRKGDNGNESSDSK